MLVRPGDRPIQELQRILASAADGPLLLVVDQLEELFTAYDSDQERAGFADALVWGPAIVVVALRADFYGRFAAYPELAERLGANHVLVGPMRASELRRTVERPAARVGLRVEPELTDQLVDDVEGEPGALPLLSTALVELWQHRQDGTLTLASYREIGGVRGAIARLAESTYARVPEEHRPIVRAIMLRLVGEGDAEAAVRRRAPLTRVGPAAAGTWQACWRRWSTGGWSRCRKEASSWPTRPCCASGRGCAAGSTRTPRGAGCAGTSPTRPRSGTRSGRRPERAVSRRPPGRRRWTGRPTTRSN